MLYRVYRAWTGFELKTLVVIGTDCIDSCKSNYHTIRDDHDGPYKETGYVYEPIRSNVYLKKKKLYTFPYTAIYHVKSIIIVFVSMKFSPTFSREHVTVLLISLEDVWMKDKNLLSHVLAGKPFSHRSCTLRNSSWVVERNMSK